MIRLKVVLLTTTIAMVVGATCAAAGQPKEWPIGRAPAAMRPAIATADLVITDVHGAFLRELRAKMAKGGPLLALGVCHMTPQRLARQLKRRLSEIPGGWSWTAPQEVCHNVARGSR